VPGAVLDFVAEQLGMADPSQVKRYTERTKTRFDHHDRRLHGGLVRDHDVNVDDRLGVQAGDRSAADMLGYLRDASQRRRRTWASVTTVRFGRPRTGRRCASAALCRFPSTMFQSGQPARS
jgi:hypothetical protein